MAEHNETATIQTAEATSFEMTHETVATDTHLELSGLNSGEGLPDEPMNELPPLEDGYDWELRQFNQEYGAPVTNTQEGADISGESIGQFDQEGHHEDISTAEASFFIPTELPGDRRVEQRLSDVDRIKDQATNPYLTELSSHVEVDDPAIQELNQAETTALARYQEFTENQELVRTELEDEYIDDLVAHPDRPEVIVPELVEETEPVMAESTPSGEGEVIDVEAKVEPLDQEVRQTQVQEIIETVTPTMPWHIKEDLNPLIAEELHRAEFWDDDDRGNDRPPRTERGSENFHTPESHELLTLTGLETISESDLEPSEQFAQQFLELMRLIKLYEYYFVGPNDYEDESAIFTYEGNFTRRRDLLMAITDQYVVAGLTLLLSRHAEDPRAFEKAVEENFDEHYDRLLIELPEDESGRSIGWQAATEKGQPLTFAIEHEIKPDQSRSLLITFPTSHNVGGAYANAQSAGVLTPTVSAGTTKETRLTVEHFGA